jgi:hypothetical protein
LKVPSAIGFALAEGLRLKVPSASRKSTCTSGHIAEVGDGGLPSRTDLPSLFAARTV